MEFNVKAAQPGGEFTKLMTGDISVIIRRQHSESKAWIWPSNFLIVIQLVVHTQDK